MKPIIPLFPSLPWTSPTLTECVRNPHQLPPAGSRHPWEKNKSIFSFSLILRKWFYSRLSRRRRRPQISQSHRCRWRGGSGGSQSSIRGCEATNRKRNVSCFGISNWILTHQKRHWTHYFTTYSAVYHRTYPQHPDLKSEERRERQSERESHVMKWKRERERKGEIEDRKLSHCAKHNKYFSCANGTNKLSPSSHSKPFIFYRFEFSAKALPLWSAVRPVPAQQLKM